MGLVEHGTDLLFLAGPRARTPESVCFTREFKYPALAAMSAELELIRTESLSTSSAIVTKS